MMGKVSGFAKCELQEEPLWSLLWVPLRCGQVCVPLLRLQWAAFTAVLRCGYMVLWELCVNQGEFCIESCPIVKNHITHSYVSRSVRMTESAFRDATMWCWESNLGPLQEQQALFLGLFKKPIISQWRNRLFSAFLSQCLGNCSVLDCGILWKSYLGLSRQKLFSVSLTLCSSQHYCVCSTLWWFL